MILLAILGQHKISGQKSQLSAFKELSGGVQKFSILGLPTTQKILSVDERGFTVQMSMEGHRKPKLITIQTLTWRNVVRVQIWKRPGQLTRVFVYCNPPEKFETISPGPAPGPIHDISTQPAGEIDFRNTSTAALFASDLVALAKNFGAKHAFESLDIK
jgi:hypothetical protein